MRVTNVAALAVLVLGASFSLPAMARERRVKMSNLPPAVRETVVEVTKGAKLRGLTYEVEKGEAFYEAELDVNGRTRDVTIDPTGAIALVEEEVAWDSVPAAVRAAIEKLAEGGKILLVETLSRNSKVEVYEAHVRRGWWKEMEFKVDPDGNPIIEK